MKFRKSISVVLLAGVMALGAACAFAAYPDRPIHVVNYVAPGGLMDVTSRKFISIAAKYTDATFVVENVTGAGGLVGLGHVLQQPADGYTVFAPTTAVVNKVISSKKSVDELIWSMEWVAMLMRDPECIIGAAEGEFNTFEKVVADAKAKNGAQLWSGPAPGGNDHVLALKVWERSERCVRWQPRRHGRTSRLQDPGPVPRRTSAAVPRCAHVQGAGLRRP